MLTYLFTYLHDSLPSFELLHVQGSNLIPSPYRASNITSTKHCRGVARASPEQFSKGQRPGSGPTIGEPGAVLDVHIDSFFGM